DRVVAQPGGVQLVVRRRVGLAAVELALRAGRRLVLVDAQRDALLAFHRQDVLRAGEAAAVGESLQQLGVAGGGVLIGQVAPRERARLRRTLSREHDLVQARGSRRARRVALDAAGRRRGGRWAAGGGRAAGRGGLRRGSTTAAARGRR